MSIPWPTLITAASTLTAGWGGISLKDWHDSRRSRHERRRAAYLELLLSLDQLRRVFGAPETLDEQAMSGTVVEGMGQAVGSIQRAYFPVFIMASHQVQQTAGQAWQAAWDIYDWFGTGERKDIEKLKRLLTAFQAKNAAFAHAVQAEEIGEPPRPPRPLFGV